MKTIDSSTYREIRSWVYKNARQIELSIWNYLFESGSKDAVISALEIYQNEDGGFGNALEADNWNPDSSPYTTLCAVNILKLIDFKDTRHPVMKGIFQFLESGKHLTDKGWLFNIPSNNNYAHAPWWSYSVEANETESTGVTLGLSCFILQFYNNQSDLYQKAIAFITNLISQIESKSNFGDMGIGGYVALLDTIKECGLQSIFDYNHLLHTVGTLVHHSIEQDTSKWVYYGVRPSNYILSPDGLFYKENEAIVQAELDYLIDTRPDHNVWGITWTWFENNEKYPKEFAISENWWKSSKAIEKLLFLRNFGRL
jgi:hypothetical protein